MDEEVTIEADSTREMSTNLDPNGRYTRIGASYEGPDGFIVNEFLELRGQEEYSSARPVIIIDEEGEISIFSHPSEVTTQGN